MRGGPRSHSTPAIEVRDLVKVYGEAGTSAESTVRAVDGISFEVPEGEFFGFLGPNGSGKTTTIRIATTLLQQTSGQVRISGLDVERDANRIRPLIGYAGQSIGVDDDLTGRENLMLTARLYHLPSTLARDRVTELLRVLTLEDAADRRAGTYSGGMRRRLDLGTGLLHHPRILFLDEPTTGLDPQTRNAVWEYLRRVHREEHLTIFLTTQYMEEADQLCERLAILDHGRLVALGTPRELKAAIGADLVTIRLPQTERFESTRASALDLARAVPEVESATAFEQGVTVRTRHGGATVVELLRRLDAAGIPVNEVAVSPPTLDQVFLQHTGHEMRSEEVTPPSRGPWARRRA
ncbi:MAG: ATP-binding cassette domain-containing protein [Thermoplasmata archaeon]